MKARTEFRDNAKAVIKEMPKMRRLFVPVILLLVLSSALAGSALAASPAWRVLGVTGPTNLPPEQSEVQRVSVDAEGGTFALSPTTAIGTGALSNGSSEVTGVAATFGDFNVGDSVTGPGIAPGSTVLAVGAETLTLSAPASQNGSVTIAATETTAPIQYNAPASGAGSVQAALEALAAFGPSSVSVAGGPGGPGGEQPYGVTFGGDFTDLDVPAMTADGSGLTGSAASVSVSTAVKGGLGTGTLIAYLTNVGGAASTGSTSLVIGPLPPGVETAGTASGIGPEAKANWSCLPAGAGQTTVTCTRTAAVPALTTTDAVEIPLRVNGSAASSSTVSVTAEGGGAAQADTYVAELKVSNLKATAGIQAMWAGAFDAEGNAATQAGGHPNGAGTMFFVNTNRNGLGNPVPAGDPREVKVDLPPGFVGNPMVTKRCPESQPIEPEVSPDGSCTFAASSIGRSSALANAFPPGVNPAVFGVFNSVPPKGYAARFTFKILQARVAVLAKLRSDEDYGITTFAPNITPTPYHVYGSAVMLEGNPAGAAGKAFLTNPSDCAHQATVTPTTTIESNSWQIPDVFGEMTVDIPPVTNCTALADEFKPGFAFQLAAQSAATGTSAEAALSVDQTNLTLPGELAAPHLKKSVVSLPEGMVLNPAAADGLEACSTAQMGLKGTGFPEPNPIRFNLNPVTCPDGSKIGTVEVTTPLLEESLDGTVYLAAQKDNPFKSLLAMYLVVEDERTGITIKLPGKVSPNAKTGQLTAEFDNNPQTPFTELNLKFRGGGPQSTLATPDVCGKYTTKGTFTPWSAPESGPPATTEDSFDITTGVGGSASCPQTKAQRPFGLGFEAGTTATQAGGDSQFSLRITRPDGNQELDKITLKMPLGLTAKLAGVTMCSDAELAQAMAPGRDGKTEMEKPSCPANSQVGTTTIGAGVGSQPYYVKTGKVYLTGPYKGAPIGLAFVVPAVAGPFDLGVQVVRTALQVNPTTAEITAVSDPIPQILEGIPLQIRDVRVDIDRPGFTRNPTSCEPMAVSGQITGGSGAVANVNNRFQVGNCGALGFSPKLQLTYKGQTKVGGNPALRAVLTQPAGEANIAYTQVVLPNGSFIDNEHINNPCTRDQWAANACPASSILGTATAYSPLLDQPLTGYVYFKSNGGERELPDIVASLKGQVNVDLVGFIDAIENKKKETSRVRNTFAIVPDAPVTRFELNMKGGKFGLIENSKNLCKNKKKNKATVRMTAHNGKRVKLEPVIKTSCRKPKPKGGKGGKKGRADQRGRASAELGRMHR